MVEPDNNFVFVLRVWRDGTDWRWSLLPADHTDRLGFADLDSLYLYLLSLTASKNAPADLGAERPPE